MYHRYPTNIKKKLERERRQTPSCTYNPATQQHKELAQKEEQRGRLPPKRPFEGGQCFPLFRLARFTI